MTLLSSFSATWHLQLGFGSMNVLPSQIIFRCRQPGRSSTYIKVVITYNLTMKFTYKILLTLITMSIFINSCKKQAPVCTGNCETINANGSVINKLTSTSAASVPVSLSWVKFVGGFSQKEVIATVNSKIDGSFNLTSNIDTTYFSKGYFLSLSVGKSNDYIILGYSGLTETRTYVFDQNAFQAKQFEVYKKANLKLKLNRTLNDNFQRYAITHSNVADFYLYDYNVQSPQEVIDRNTSEINIETVADVYTKIKTVKTFANGTSTTTLDSVICTTSSTSIYDVTF